LGVVASILVTSCVSLIPSPVVFEPPQSTFDRLVQLAKAGDARSQMAVGYMAATGRGTSTDYRLAHRWFENAAERGSAAARLNLSVLYYLGAGVRRDSVEAARQFGLARTNAFSANMPDIGSLPALVEASCHPPVVVEDLGGEVFRTFCAGCHGMDGIAEYGSAPSFAFGERMEKETSELLTTVLTGHSSMPRWDDKLPSEWLESGLEFARLLERRYVPGLIRAYPETSPQHFRFGPMGSEFGTPVDSATLTGPGAPTLLALCEEI